MLDKRVKTEELLEHMVSRGIRCVCWPSGNGLTLPRRPQETGRRMPVPYSRNESKRDGDRHILIFSDDTFHTPVRSCYVWVAVGALEQSPKTYLVFEHVASKHGLTFLLGLGPRGNAFSSRKNHLKTQY